MPFQVPIRPHLTQMKPYVPGKPIEELERELGVKNASKIASNENPLGPSPLVFQALQAAQGAIHRYPDGSAHRLTQKLSSYLAVDSSTLMLGNGSNELIVLLGQMTLEPGAEAVYADKSFVVYPLVTQMMGAVHRVIPLSNFTHDLPAFGRALNERTRVVFICNPNNPTGTAVSQEAIKSFLEGCPPGVLVILDEAYQEYQEEAGRFASLKIQETHPNLVVLRTFSKVFGLAGLRIGYGVAHPSLVEVFQKIRQPFNVNHLAMKAAEAALSDPQHVGKVLDLNRRMRDKLTEGLRKLGYSPAPSQANFVYFEVSRADEIYEKLLRKGVIVRPMGPGALRVTTGTEQETENFLKTFGRLAGEMK